MKKIFGIFALSVALLCGGGVWAAAPQAASQASPQAGKAVPDKPEKTVNRVTVVSVELEGSDSLGARLGTRLKERFNQSSLFTLNGDEEKDVPKLYLLLSTQAEFAGRPAVGSVYSVCWIFKQGKGYLGYLLGRDLGVVAAEDLDGLVDKLVERTDGIATKYSSLWK